MRQGTDTISSRLVIDRSAHRLTSAPYFSMRGTRKQPLMEERTEVRTRAGRRYWTLGSERLGRHQRPILVLARRT
jgi:hypothetical protein